MSKAADDRAPLALPTGIALKGAEETRPLDWYGIAQRLERSGLAFDRTFTPRQFSGGLANLNFLVRLESGWVVLRRPPDGPLPPGAHDMRREHRILSGLWRELPLAPRSLHYCDDAAVAGAPFQLLEFRSGVAVRGDRMAPLGETAVVARSLANTMIETLSAIHAVDVRKAGLEDLGRPGGFFRRTAASWVDRASRVIEGGLSNDAAAIAEWLDRAPAPKVDRATLLHNDFKLDNLLLDSASLMPTAILDWDMGTQGDPLFDLATTLSYWCQANDAACMHRLAQMPTAREGFPDREAAAQMYDRITGRSIAEIKPYRVLTMLKLGVVFHQLNFRYRSGETNDVRYAAFGDLGNDLFAFTLQIINDKIF
ncbi:MAG: phosphotransferase family protein [Bradyrhizobium sp.]|uniref:phosphotransferase family protein n=1 Tax=Bradyrhizobium sp. TaxID=376 RepID=UPI0025B81A14|nr:phosphotransferase family protein [Bradyrhizobium sp.]MBI5260731.1 phosphotransferase family protein [Bradyrhizobium sp.]